MTDKKPVRRKRPQPDVATVLANTVFDGRDQIKAINDDVSTAQSELVVLMQSGKRRTLTVPNTTTGKGDLTVTLVEGSTVTVDEAKLKAAVGAQMWNKITTRVLDRKKLDAFIASGEVNPMIVARASDEKPRAPFVKVAPKRGS